MRSDLRPGADVADPHVGAAGDYEAHGLVTAVANCLLLPGWALSLTFASGPGGLGLEFCASGRNRRIRAVSRRVIGTSVRAGVTQGAVMALARWTPYLESEMLGLADLVGPGSVCLDVGAAAGLYSFVLSRLVGPSGHVHSIEPLQFAHPAWRRVLGIQSLKNLSQYTMALDAEPGKGVMSVPFGRRVPVTGRSFLTGRSSGLGPNAEFVRHEEVPVPVETMDALIARTGVTRLDFIKIDVEGGELHVLHGGERTVKEFRPALLVEIEARHTARYQYAPDDIVNWLIERDYAMYTWHDGWQRTSQVSLEQRNYLFRPNQQPS